MQSPDQDPDQWSRIANEYERSFEPLTSQLADHLLPLLDLNSGTRVIDVAAGAGSFSFAVAKAGIHALAVDFAPGMVSRLRERAAAGGFDLVQAEVMDGQALALPDASFDAGVSILGVMFFPDIQKGLKELRRVVRPGGKVAIVSWGDIRKLQPQTLLVQAIKQVLPSFEPPSTPPVWTRLAGTESLRREMQAAGLRGVDITTIVVTFPIGSPEAFWSNFTASAPPIAYLFKQMRPEHKAAVGSAFLDLLKSAAGSAGGSLSAEVCIGIGRS